MTEHWILLGIITGAFWGIIALSFYTPWKALKEAPTHLKITSPLQQFVFNFVCGFAGWYCLYWFEFKRYSSSWPNLIILILALAGISGRLSPVMWGIAEIVKKWIEKLMEKHLAS